MYLDGQLTNIMSANDLAADIAGLQAGKQDKLVSGSNIKTINGASVLGSGDMTLGILEESITVTTDVGHLTVGTVIPAGTPVESIIRMILE